MASYGARQICHPRRKNGEELRRDPRLATTLGLLLIFGFAFSWIGATIGLLVLSVERAVCRLYLALPATFASSTFVPTNSMPDWLRAFRSPADHI